MGLFDYFTGDAQARIRETQHQQKLWDDEYARRKAAYEENLAYERDQGRVKNIYGQAPGPTGAMQPTGPTTGMSPMGQATPGAMTPVGDVMSPGTGLWDTDPVAKERARAQLGMLSPAAFQPAYTATVQAPFDMAKMKEQERLQAGAAMARQQQAQKDTRLNPVLTRHNLPGPGGVTTVLTYNPYKVDPVAEQDSTATLTSKQFAQKQALTPGQITVTDENGVTTTVAGASGDLEKTFGRRKADASYAVKYVDWTTSGKYDAAKSISQLAMVTDKLAPGGHNLTGPIKGLLPNIILPFVDSEAMDVKEAVQEVVQRSLKPILGAQFARIEGENLIKRAFNPQLSEEMNYQRVMRLSNLVKDSARAMEATAKYWETNGTLAGYVGQEPNEAVYRDLLRQWEEEDSKLGVSPQGPPSVGVVEDGYRFLGGDPSNPSNWAEAK